jgi:phage minor structural protein
VGTLSYPVLYSATETNFDHNGFGILSACVSCDVTEEANGIFELSMQYPMDGIHFEEIANRSIIKAKADQFRDPQLFRVYAISKPMSGIVLVSAEHISYDLSGIPVSPFSAIDASSALAGLKENAATECPFNFWTDKETQATFKVSVPASIRSRLGGVEGSVMDVYGGEYEFDNYTVKLHKNRGVNRGVSIRYGKNLTDIQQDQNCSNVATGVYPYWNGMVDEATVLVELPEKIVNAPGEYNFVRIKTLDLTSAFESKPTEEQLRDYAERYVSANEIGVPSVSLSVSFAQLDQCDEYKHLNLLERVSLFDTVNVEFPALKVSATAKAVKMVYDVLADRVKSVTLGSVRANIADTIANQAQTTKELFKMVRAPQVAPVSDTDWITNGRGYMVAVRDDEGNWMEICSLDEPDINTAKNVWRWNNGGFGFSSNGYGGPYTLAITQDGHIVADFVTAGTLASHDGKIFFNLTDGIFAMQDVDTNGKECKFRLDSGGFWVMGEDSANFTLLADSLSTVLRTFTTPMKIYSDVSIDIQAPSVTINGKSY